MKMRNEQNQIFQPHFTRRWLPICF